MLHTLHSLDTLTQLMVIAAIVIYTVLFATGSIFAGVRFSGFPMSENTRVFFSRRILALSVVPIAMMSVLMVLALALDPNPNLDPLWIFTTSLGLCMYLFIIGHLYNPESE